MENAAYVTLNRQSGLLRAMDSIAQNVANLGTAGYRAERVVFAEHVAALEDADSLSMAHATARATSLAQGALTMTGGTFDLAVEGPGFFLLATPEGDRLTRAGAFVPSPEGFLAAPDGAALLDAGGAPIFVPPDARSVSVAADGTLSADGRPLAQIGLWTAENAAGLERRAGVRFDPGGPPVPLSEGRIVQGFLESSNVDPVAEIARMVEVQRAYELGQAFLDREDERVRSVIRTVGQ